MKDLGVRVQAERHVGIRTQGPVVVKMVVGAETDGRADLPRVRADPTFRADRHKRVERRIAEVAVVKRPSRTVP